MSDDLKRALDTALARIAALETARQPSPAAPHKPDFDPQAFARAFATDPVGVMTRMGVPVDHVSRVLVAHQLGDAAPLELRMLAQQGPMMSAHQALASDLQTVRQRLETYEERDRKVARREGFSALASDKTKYPTLAAAYAKNPKLFDSEVESFQGDPAAYAESMNARLTALAPALGTTPPASSENAAAQGQSSQAKQAHGAVDMTPPPLPSSNSGVFNQEAHEAAKARVLAKYGADS